MSAGKRHLQKLKESSPSEHAMLEQMRGGFAMLLEELDTRGADPEVPEDWPGHIRNGIFGLVRATWTLCNFSTVLTAAALDTTEVSILYWMNTPEYQEFCNGDAFGMKLNALADRAVHVANNILSLEYKPGETSPEVIRAQARVATAVMKIQVDAKTPRPPRRKRPGPKDLNQPGMKFAGLKK